MAIDVKEERFLRIAEVMAMTGLSRPAIYVEMRDRELPRPIRVGSRAVRWKLSEILAWMESREVVTSEVGPRR